MTLEEVGNSFYTRIVKYCYYRTSKNRADAEDIAGEVFLRLGQKWDNLKDYDENRILGWLYGTANKVMLEQHKIKLTQEAVTSSLTANNGADIELPDETVDGYEENRKFENYISQIKEELCAKDFEFFEYIVIQKLPYKDVGQKFSISESAAKMRWQRLKGKLKPILDHIFGGKM